MTHFARRDFMKLMAMGGSAAMLGGATHRVTGLSGVRSVAAQTATLGTVVRITRGPVTLHTYVAPEQGILVTSHIIETANSLVIVDSQVAQTFARDFRAYVDSIGKPVERIMLSHEHPDHWMGANNFAEFPFFATETTIANTVAAIEAGTVDNLAALFGEDEVPDEPNAPTEAITVDSEMIDGVTFEYATYTNHESADSLVITLPEAGTAIVQDLLYNNTHFFPGVDRDNWISILQELRAQSSADLLLVGHGLPTAPGQLDIGIEYLTFVQETIPTVESAAELIESLEAKYPTYGGDELIGFWNLFFPAS
ncbi:MAG: MBL fold metallo-hydrolase [Chloroflexota bacterium]